MSTDCFHEKLTKGMLRTLLLALLLLAMPAESVRAQTDAPVYLVVSLAGGDCYEYELAERPVVAFLGEKFRVSSGQMEQEFAAADVAGFHFSLQATGIDRAAAGRVVNFRFTDGGSVALDGLPQGGVRLFDTSGRLLRSVPVEAGSATVGLDGLAPGIYVLAPEGVPAAIKISKK